MTLTCWQGSKEGARGNYNSEGLQGPGLKVKGRKRKQDASKQEQDACQVFRYVCMVCRSIYLRTHSLCRYVHRGMYLSREVSKYLHTGTSVKTPDL